MLPFPITEMGEGQKGGMWTIKTTFELLQEENKKERKKSYDGHKSEGI